MRGSHIAWTDSTWNPWVGCTKISPGCENCYAATMDRRWGKDRWGPGHTRTRTSERNWRQPILWNRQCEKLGQRERVFCASLADVFDTEAPGGAREDLWKLIADTPSLDWLILTKRIGSVAGLIPDEWHVCFPPNVWLGTTVEDQKRASQRIPRLMQWRDRCSVLWLSVEPQIEEITLWPFIAPRIGRTMLDWVICGGESGYHARPFDLDWARKLRDQCRDAGVSFFMKQLGSSTVVKTEEELVKIGRLLGKKDHVPNWPEEFRIQEVPTPRELGGRIYG